MVRALKRRPLLWQLFPPFLLVILLSLVLVTGYSGRSVRHFSLDKTAADLAAQGHLLVDRLVEPVRTGDRTAVQELCRRLGEVSGNRVTVILPSGEVIGDSREDPAHMDNHAGRPEIRTAYAGGIGRSTRYSHTLNQRMLYVALPLAELSGGRAVLRTSVSVSDLDDALRSVYVGTALAGVLVLLLATALSYWLSQRISSPLVALREGAERFARGELQHSLPAPDSKEIGELADVMTEMAHQLDDRLQTVVGQRNELEAVLAGMVEGVLAVDLDMRLRSINRAGAALLESDQHSIIGMSVYEVIRNADLLQLIDNAFACDDPIATDIVLHGAQERLLQVQATTLQGQGGERVGSLLVLHDVTRLRRLERVRQDFVANVSHELRTPITTIKGFVETLLDDPPDAAEGRQRFLRIIAEHADRLDAIINDLLCLSSIEQDAKQARIELASTVLRPILTAALESCAPRAASRDIGMELDCRETLRADVNARLLEQAVVNLLDNAIKYSSDGGQVNVFARRVDGRIHVSIQDDGCGIASEHLPRLWERFYRVDMARSRRLGGTGLGLAIVKHIAQAHGGNVDVESEPGIGSTFSIYLPG